MSFSLFFHYIEFITGTSMFCFPAHFKSLLNRPFDRKLNIDGMMAEYHKRRKLPPEIYTETEKKLKT